MPCLSSVNTVPQLLNTGSVTGYYAIHIMPAPTNPNTTYIGFTNAVAPDIPGSLANTVNDLTVGRLLVPNTVTTLVANDFGRNRSGNTIIDASAVYVVASGAGNRVFYWLE